MIFKKISIITLLYILVIPVHGEKKFSPLNSKVTTGDKTINNISLHKKHEPNNNNNKVRNGAQAGAFFLVRFFQEVISPQDGPRCPFYPTCSHYGKQAVKKHGALLGSFLAGDRILRCNPYTIKKKDPVPEKIFSK